MTTRLVNTSGRQPDSGARFPTGSLQFSLDGGAGAGVFSEPSMRFPCVGVTLLSLVCVRGPGSGQLPAAASQPNEKISQLCERVCGELPVYLCSCVSGSWVVVCGIWILARVGLCDWWREWGVGVEHATACMPPHVYILPAVWCGVLLHIFRPHARVVV